MGYSRSARRQLIGVDLVEGVVDAVRQANPSHASVDQILRRVAELQKKLRAQLAWINRNGGVVFESRREYRRYQAELSSVQEAILTQWSGQELDGREYLNAVLVCVDQLAQNKSRTQGDWQEMLEQLQRLYQEMDPDLSAEACMEVGEQAAEVLRDAMEEV